MPFANMGTMPDEITAEAFVDRLTALQSGGESAKDDLDDTFALAEILVGDEHEMVQTVTGGMLREAGKHDRERLLAFLDRHAAAMPRRGLRDATEHLDERQRAHYRSLRGDG